MHADQTLNQAPYTGKLPKIAVLLATYNGKQYVGEQLTSILNQSDCAVTVFVSDDSSKDGTLEFIGNLSAQHPGKIVILRHGQRFGSAGGNFRYLIGNVDASGFDAVAFADQDDIWESDHLSSSLKRIHEAGLVGISGNTMAFWEDGRQLLYRKSQPQRAYDYLFESPGPGCTFVLTPQLFRLVQMAVTRNRELAAAITYHDWTVYALARASGGTWEIQERPTVRYRQHGGNEIGARTSGKGIWMRWKRIRSGWYGDQVRAIVRLVNEQGYLKDLSFKEALYESSLGSRLKLAASVPKFRRNLPDQVVLLIVILTGSFWAPPAK